MRSGRRSTVALAASLAVVVVAGCGGSNGSGGRDGGRGGDGARAGIVPTKAAVIATLRLERGADSAGVPQARKILGRVPAWRSIDRTIPTPDELIETLEQEGVLEGDLAYADDIEPWLGPEGGAAAWLNPGARGDEAVGVIVWLDVTDAKAARSAAEQAFGTSSQGEEYAGVDIHEGELEDGTSIVWATFEQRLVVAMDRPSIEASIDAAGGTSFEDREQWNRLVSERDATRGTTIARLVLTRALVARDGLDQIAATHDRAAELVEELQAAQGARLLQDDRVDGIALQVGATERGPWIDLVAAGDLPIASASSSAVETLGRLPIGSAVGVASTRGIDGPGGQLVLGSRLAEQLGAAIGDEGAAGVVLGDSNVPLLVLGADGAADAERADEAMAELSDAASKSMRDLAEAQLEVFGNDIDNVFDLDAISAQPVEWQVTSGEALLAATGKAALDRIETSWVSGSDTLADDPAFAATVEAAGAPDDASVAWWIDTTAIGRVIADALLDERTAGVAGSQLAVVSGPLGWLEVDREDGITIARAATELALRP